MIDRGADGAPTMPWRLWRIVQESTFAECRCLASVTTRILRRLLRGRQRSMANLSRAKAPVWPRFGRDGRVDQRVQSEITLEGVPVSALYGQFDARGALASRRPVMEFALSIALLLLVLCGLICSVALAIWAHDVSHAWRDVTLANHIRAYATPWLTSFLLSISHFGDPAEIALTVPLLAVVLFTLRRPAQAVTLLLSVFGGTAIATSFKPLVARLGPGESAIPSGLLGFNHYAFPSGHAVYFITCFVPLAWFLWEWRPRGSLGWRMAAHVARVLICLALLVLTALGGFAQIYLGYHWPSDVAGGYAIGGFWVGLVLLAYLRFGRRLAQPRAA